MGRSLEILPERSLSHARNPTIGPHRSPLSESRGDSSPTESAVPAPGCPLLPGTPLYQEVFNRLKLTPDDFQTVEDVQKLPVTTKQDYLSNSEAFRLTALPEFLQEERTLWDVNYTTGTTTGIPAPFFNTTYDIFTSGEPTKRFASMVGLTVQDIVINLYPLTPFPHLT